MGTLPPVVLELVANGSKLSAGLDKAQADIDKMSKNGATSFEKFSATASKVGAAVGASMTAMGAVLFSISDEMNDAQASLQTAIQNSGHDFKDYQADIEKTVKAEENFGHTSADTQTALAKLTTALGDPKKALDDMALATDLAAFKHINLAGAADILVKAHAGSSKAFKEFGINLADYGTGAEAAEKALAVLAERIKGQAAAQVDTIDIVKAKLTDFVATIGSKIAPALQVGGPLLMGMSQIPVVLGGISKGFTAASSALGGFAPVVAVAGAAFVTLGAIWQAFRASAEKARERVAALSAAVEKSGESAGVVAGRQMLDYIAAHKDAAKWLAKAGVSQEDLARAMIQGGSAYDGVTAKVKALSDHQFELNGQNADGVSELRDILTQMDQGRSAMAAYQAQQDALAAAQNTVNAAMQAQALIQSEGAQVQSVLSKGAIERAENTDILAKKLDAQKAAEAAATKAVNDRKQAEDNLHNALIQKFKDVDEGVLRDLALTNADVAVRNGQRDLKQALDDVKKAHNDGGKAADDFLTKQTQVVANVLTATKAYAEQKGARDGTVESANLQIVKLTEERETFGKEYPLVRAEIDKQIQALKDLALAANLSRIAMAEAGKGVAGFEYTYNTGQGPLRARASGGPVSAMTPYLVGERGPEMFIPNAGGRIIPNDKVSLKGGGGGMAVYLTVNAGMGADGAAIGQQVVDALKSYERSNGTSWRAAA